MKKGLKYVLSVLVCLLLVGTGFSVWYFASEANKTGAINGSVSVTDNTSLTSSITVKKAGAANFYDSAVDGDTKAASELDITLDQGSNPTSLSELIYFSSASETSIDLVITFTLSGDDSDELAAANYATSITLSEALGNYIQTSFTDTAAATDSTSDNTRTITVYKTLSFTYKTGMKPTSSTEYDAMKTALATDQSVTLNVSITEA